MVQKKATKSGKKINNFDSFLEIDFLKLPDIEFHLT